MQNMLRKQFPGMRYRPEVELDAHTRRDVAGSSISGSESSDQLTRLRGALHYHPNMDETLPDSQQV